MLTPLDPNVALVTMAVKELDLGSAGDVAELFTKHGITGRQVSPYYCPGVRYLVARTGLTPDAGEPRISLGSQVSVRTVAGHWENIPVPTALKWFMSEFDKGSFTALRDPVSPGNTATGMPSILYGQLMDQTPYYYNPDHFPSPMGGLVTKPGHGVIYGWGSCDGAA